MFWKQIGLLVGGVGLGIVSVLVPPLAPVTGPVSAGLLVAARLDKLKLGNEERKARKKARSE